MNLSNLTALELGKKIQSKEISVWEAVTAFFPRRHTAKRA